MSIPTSLAKVRALSDDALLSSLGEIARNDRRLEAELLALIGEVDARELYLELGHSSAFSYCRERLRFSEGAAYHRIRAARTARKYPVILELIRSGDLHPTGVTVLAPHLTKQNHAELLERARGLAKRQIEALVADLAPKPDAPAFVRRLPTPPAPREPGGPAPTPVSQPASRAAAAPTSPPLEPLGDQRFKVQFTADAVLSSKLEKLRALLRHQIPDGDLAKVIGLAVERLLTDVERKKLGRAERPRPAAKPKQAGPSRHVPNAIRRQVVQRDGLRCTFVGRDGRRCDATAFLEFQHDDTWARHGTHRKDRIRVYCRAHNQWAADREFGRAHMDRARRGELSPARVAQRAEAGRRASPADTRRPRKEA